MLLRKLSYIIKNQLKALNTHFLSFAVSLCDKGGFYTEKGSIKGAGVSKIMIPPMIDYF